MKSSNNFNKKQIEDIKSGLSVDECPIHKEGITVQDSTDNKTLELDGCCDRFVKDSIIKALRIARL
jgi:hypothetical protein